MADIESGLIFHHDVYNDANHSRMLHPMSVAAKKVLEVDQIQVLTDGGYSNAEEIARCEREGIEVAAPIKRGATNSGHFRPAKFVCDDASDTIRCRPGRPFVRLVYTPGTGRSDIAFRPARAAG